MSLLTSASTRPICITFVQSSNFQRKKENSDNHAQRNSASIETTTSVDDNKRTIPQHIVMTTGHQNVTSSALGVYSPHTQTATFGRYFEYSLHSVATTCMYSTTGMPTPNVYDHCVATLNDSCSYSQQNANITGAINRNVCINSLQSEHRQHFATCAGMHGPNNCQNFVCGGNNMNSVDDRNFRQENLRAFVTEACTMSNNVQHHHCTPVFTPRKHVTFSDPSIPVDNYNGNAMSGQRNTDANFDFDNGYANVREVVALLPNPTPP